MRILETGNESGYTLLEILVIIVLLAIVFGLAYAGLSTGAEKTAVYSIGQLITGDLRKVRDEAIFNQQETVIEIFTDGYHYQIDSADINRSFKNFQFAFTIPEPEVAPSTDVTAAGVSEADESVKPPKESQAKTLGVKFGVDGKSDGAKLEWQTSHFKGYLSIEQDGAVSWHYERK